jgi:predicted TIM-barrel fold metal-dependent hydrolase
MQFFDSLVHTTPDGTWLGARRYDASVSRLVQDMDAAGIERACLVAIAGVVSNEHVLEVTVAHPGRFVPIGSINPTTYDDEIDRVVRELAQQGFAGLKLHPRLNAYDPLDLRCLDAIDTAGRHGLVLFLDTFFRQPDRPTRHALDVIDVIAQQCPHTQIVLLHGTGPSLLEATELVRVHRNLTLDVSFTLLKYQGSSLDLDLGYVFSRLDQRVIVGSDFPEFLPSAALGRVRELTQHLPEEKQRNICFENLSRLFARRGE